MTIYNRSPHEVILIDNNNQVIRTWPACEDPIRLAKMAQPIGVLETDIPLVEFNVGRPTNLPLYRKGVYYIVSFGVKSAVWDRPDLLVPAVMDIRNNRKFACRAFAK